MQNDEQDKMTKEDRERYREKIEAHSYHLNKLISSAATEGVKFLGLLNLGGIAAVLGFMGAVKTHSLPLVVALAFFLFAAILTAATHLLRYLHFDSLFKTYQIAASAGWTSSTNSGMAKELNDWNANISVKRDWSLCTAIASLLLFFAGALIATIGTCFT
ncbi:hypothetical protein EHZ19_27080 [Paraburkholderia bannensis]|nr:hypothetical protein [Paraburkholderia bannensis]RQM44768.1 hypothetical protein EHZ19_27080 [Paraburkholderia bannensis]